MNSSLEIGLLVSALIKAQQEFDPVLKSKNNPFFKSKYADLLAGIEATQPALIANGLVVTQFPVSNTDGVGVLSILAHTSGQFISQEYVLPLGKKDAQTGVAAVTYARRCAYLAIIGVAAEDDDGNTAVGRWKEPKKIAPPRAEIPAELPKTTPLVFLSTPNHGDAMPDDNQMAEFGERIKALAFTLKSNGLTDKNLPPSRKIIAYLLRCVGVKDPKEISVVQFEEFLEFAGNANPKSLAAMVEAGYK